VENLRFSNKQFWDQTLEIFLIPKLAVAAIG